MKRMILFAVIVVLVGSVIFAAGQKGTEKASDEIIIGFTVNDFNDLWVTFIMDAAKEWDEKQPGVTVVLGNGETDVNTQFGIVETWISQGFDAIVVKPVEVEATVAMANLAKSANVPYVAVQQAIKEASARVLQNSIVTGENQMQAVLNKLGGKGKVAIMVGEPGTLVAQERLTGNKNILSKYPDVELVAEEVGNWQRDQGMTIMENWLQAGIKMDAIVASNDEMALGAILALEAAGVREKYIVAGIDATPNALEFMADGRLDITMYADAHTLAYKSLDTALALIKGENPADLIISDVLVTPENVTEFIN